MLSVLLNRVIIKVLLVPQQLIVGQKRFVIIMSLLCLPTSSFFIEQGNLVFSFKESIPMNFLSYFVLYFYRI